MKREEGHKRKKGTRGKKNRKKYERSEEEGWKSEWQKKEEVSGHM